MSTSWFESLNEREHAGNLGEDERIMLKLISMYYVRRLRTGLIVLRIGTGGGLL
jgi:hypothetical protein